MILNGKRKNNIQVNISFLAFFIQFRFDHKVNFHHKVQIIFVLNIGSNLLIDLVVPFLNKVLPFILKHKQN